LRCWRCFGRSKRISRQSRNCPSTRPISDRAATLPFEAPADTIYGALRAGLEQAGRLIGPNDLLIAAQARALGLTIVTDNERKFARVGGLPIENWLR
jgi:tRNA(fMet)-specific endonuclease VapC